MKPSRAPTPFQSSVSVVYVRALASKMSKVTVVVILVRRSADGTFGFAVPGFKNGRRNASSRCDGVSWVDGPLA
jgi:hypothetical protein